MSLGKEHRHSWELHISSVGKDRVVCRTCGKQFYASNQVIPYMGQVPEKFL
jgi:hypothetical protein